MRKLRIFFSSCVIIYSLTSTCQGQQKITDPYVLIDTLKAQVSRETIEDKKIWLTIRLAISYKSVGNYKEGLKIAHDAASLAEKTNSKRLASAYNMIGVFNKDLGNYEQAVIMYKKVLALVEVSNDQGGIASTHNNLANVYANQGKPQEALKSFEAALEIYRKLKSKDGEGIALGNIATIYMDEAKYEAALTNSFMAFNLFAETGYKSGMAAAHNNIGDIYRMQGNYNESSKYLFSSLRYYDEAKDDAGRILANNSLGNLYSDQSNYEEGLKYYEFALKIAETIGDKKGVADALGNVGFSYQRLEKYKEALKSHEEALKIQKELENKQGIATSLNNIGAIYVRQKSFHVALESLASSVKISEEINDRSAIADTYNSIGSAFYESALTSKGELQKSHYQQALDHYRKAELMAKSQGLRKIVQDSYEGQALVYEKKNNFRKAYEFRTLYSNLKDSLINDQTSKKLENLRIKYEVQKAQEEEKSKQEKQKAAMLVEFNRREDSIKYQQKIVALQLSQQTFISKQQEQDLKLKQASLELLDKQNELNRINYLKSQAELQVEQTKREEKEQQLTIANQEKSLQSTQLDLQKTQLNFKEIELQAQRRQRLFLIGGIILLALLFIVVYRSIKNKQRTERLVSAERLKTEKANAAHTMAELELQSLRAQLNPHFMFNSLNAIQELILKEDNDNSHLYLSRFSELLRMLLDNANQPFVPLRKELNLLELYLSLEKLRIPDLQYAIEIDKEIDANKITIPNMMLQPYIENAIWHGLSHKKGGKSLLIKIIKSGNSVICKVEDNGVGRKMASELKSLYRKEHRSKGMELLSKRFILLSKEYGADIQTSIEDLHDNGTALGTRVAITLPAAFVDHTKPVYT